MSPVGDRLRSARKRAGLSQRDLACDGASYAYISRIEAGVRTPSVKVLRKLAPKLGVSVEWLETGKEEATVEVDGSVYAVPRPVADLVHDLYAQLHEREAVPAG